MDAIDGLAAFTSYHRQMFIVMAIICAIVSAALFIGVPSPDHAWAGGFAAGAAAQLLKFGILDIAAIRKIAAEREAAAMTQVKSMFMSLVIFGLAVVAVYALRLNVWSMAAGIFLPRIILVVDTWIRPNPFAGAGAGRREDG